MIGILKGLGMKVLAYDAFPRPEEAARLGFAYTSLDELYRKADIVSLHCPLTPETRHLLGRDAIAKMKDGVMIINTGRGGLIDSARAHRGTETEGRSATRASTSTRREGVYFFKDFFRRRRPRRRPGAAPLLPERPRHIASGLPYPGSAQEHRRNDGWKTRRPSSREKNLTNEICYLCDKQDCAKKMTGRCF